MYDEKRINLMGHFQNSVKLTVLGSEGEQDIRKKKVNGLSQNPPFLLLLLLHYCCVNKQ